MFDAAVRGTSRRERFKRKKVERSAPDDHPNFVLPIKAVQRGRRQAAGNQSRSPSGRVSPPDLLRHFAPKDVLEIRGRIPKHRAKRAGPGRRLTTFMIGEKMNPPVLLILKDAKAGFLPRLLPLPGWRGVAHGTHQDAIAVSVVMVASPQSAARQADRFSAQSPLD